MMQPAVPTRQRMLETAVRMFQHQGYHATSWRTLVEQAGTPWGSAHHHFPGGKEQLGVSAVEFGGAAVSHQLEQVFAAHRTPAAAIRAWGRSAAEQLEQSGYVDGCPIATVALETTSSSEPLAAACKRVFEQWIAIVAERLVRAGLKKKRAQELATFAVVSIEGALLVARLLRSPGPMLIAVEMAAAAVEAETP